MEEIRKNYVDYCKDFAVNELESMKGSDNVFYACDLASELAQGINVDGSATYSTYEAKQYIKEWFDEAGEVYEYEKNNFGEVFHNPFEEPEAFHVCMIIHGVENILSQCEIVKKAWDDNITLTDAKIKKLIKQIEAVSEINF